MKVLAFDINETLLDLSALDSLFNGFFGSPLARHEWFEQVLRNAFVTTITGWYYPLPQLAKAALDLMEQRYPHHKLTEGDRDEVLRAMQTLPAHSDAAPALKQLASHGYTLVALGNNTGEIIEAQLRHTDLWQYFRHIFGAETVQRMKPAKEPYHFVARSLNCALDQITMVSCHDWDIAGAHAAGLNTAFIHRPGH
ncbi:MAG: haloacid dehalogenase type II, partial [Acidobacteriales bacterium]|nr:haloacid dehalogenase type II [Terriglobales bacterium]